MAFFVLYTILTATLVVTALLHPQSPDWVKNWTFVANALLLAAISLLSYLAYHRERNYRDVFFFFWVYFAAAALATPVFALIVEYGPPQGGVIAYILIGLIGIHTGLAWAVTGITVGYWAPRRRRVVHLAIATLGLFAAVLWLYSPYVFDPLAIMQTAEDGSQFATYDSVWDSSVVLNVFSFLMLLAFYVHKLRTDKPIGAYADTLLFLFALLLLVDTAELMLTQSEIEILNISQWVVLLINVSMVITLVLRLKFKTQTISDYYESQCLSNDPAIDRRIGVFDRLVLRTFFDPEKIGKKVFLGTGQARLKVRRTPRPLSRHSHG